MEGGQKNEVRSLIVDDNTKDSVFSSKREGRGISSSMKAHLGSGEHERPL